MVQLEALDAADFASTLEAAILQHLDEGTYNSHVSLLDEQRAEARSRIS